MATSEDTRIAWETVADRLEALGLKLKLHFEQAESAQHPGEEVSKAFARLGTAIESTFSSIGTAVKDPAIRDDANTLAANLGDALADTLSRAARELAGAANGLRCPNRSEARETFSEPKSATAVKNNEDDRISASI